MLQTPCPFREGEKYRIKHEYSFLNHRFFTDQIVIFMSSAYSPYDGLTRYWFKRIDSEESNAWHVFDNEEQETHWNDLFEEIKTTEQGAASNALRSWMSFSVRSKNL